MEARAGLAVEGNTPRAVVRIQRFLILATETRPVIGGVAAAIDGWATGLAVLGHDVRVVSLFNQGFNGTRETLPPRPYAEQWIRFPGRKAVWADRLLPVRKLRSAAYLMRRNNFIKKQSLDLVRSFRPDHVIFAYINQLCCAGLDAIRELGIPCNAIAYAAELRRERVSKPAWLRGTLQKFERIIAISSYTRCLLLDWGVPPEKISIVHPSISSDLKMTRRKKSDAGKRKLLTVARLVERKGIQTVLEAIARMKSETIEYHIVGEGPFKPALERRAKELGLNGAVTFHGNVPPEERLRLFAECDLFVMAPHETGDGDVEGFGIVYLEAGAFGKPVIGSRSGGVSDAVLDGQTGVLVESGNTAAVHDAIATLLADEGRRARLGSNGREWAAEHTPTEIARRFESVLLGCVS